MADSQKAKLARKSSLSIDGHAIALTDEQLMALASASLRNSLDHEHASSTTEFERRVLWRVCENGRSKSSVTIAMEEWGGWDDPISADTVQWALEQLNLANFVVYTLGEHGLFTDVRATKEGYAEAGYPPPQYVIGEFQHGAQRWRKELEPHLRPGDATDFHNLDHHTWGGEIEKMPLEEHLRKYPNHYSIHIRQEDDVSSRETYYRAQGLPDFTTDPVSSVVREMSEQEVHGKKQTILLALRTYGMAQDVATLSSWTRKIGKEGPGEMGMNPPEIAKLLWAMQKTQLVTFKERAGGLFKIRMTDVAAATFKKEKRGRPPVERVAVARKPEIIPSVEYKVPEPPRYAAPAPPAQNIKSSIDEEVAGAQVPASATQVTERNVVVDTHTQYQPEVKHNLYPKKPNSKAGMISQRVAGRFLDGLDKIGGHGTRRAAAIAVGINPNSRPTTISQAAEHWGWIERTDGGEVALTDVGRDIVRQYRRSEHGRDAIVPEDKIPEPRRSVRAQMNGVEAMEVVSRNEADAEPKEPEIDRDTYNGQPMAPNLDQFPLIKDLITRSDAAQKYEQAAEILMEIDENAASNLLNRIQITDLEREVIRFVRTIQG